jgi:TubC N-terminal docking domain/Thioesterase domain
VTVQAFLAELRARDVRVWADGDRLRCNAPADALTPALHEQLRARKPEMLAFLHSAQVLGQRHRAIVPLQSRGARAPVFGVPGHNGDVFCYLGLAAHLVADEQPLYGLQPPGLDGVSEPLTRIEEIAAYFAAQIRAFHPTGPCVIAGFCAGGAAAFELGRHLLRDRRHVIVALLGAPYLTRYGRLPGIWDEIAGGALTMATTVARHGRALWSLRGTARLRYVSDKLRFRRRPVAPDPVLVMRGRVERATVAALRRYTPRPFMGRLCLFVPCREWVRSGDQPLRWRALAPRTELFYGPEGCTRDTMLHDPYAGSFAGLLRQCASAFPDTAPVAPPQRPGFSAQCAG